MNYYGKRTVKKCGPTRTLQHFKIARLCAECVACGFAIQESPPVLARGFFARMNGYIRGLDHAGVWADAKKGNHWPRRMGCHGSVGNGAGRARAASTETRNANEFFTSMPFLESGRS